MVTITSLPEEIIFIILGYDSIEDIMSFTSTCKRKLQDIIWNNNKFWEKKYYERCPTARKKYDTKKQKEIVHHSSFAEKIKASTNCIKKLQHYVSLMSDNNLTKMKKIRLERLLRTTVEDSMIYFFVLDELNRIISQRQHNDNLTNTYYLGLISYYLKQYSYIYKLTKFLKMPEEKQLLEQLFIIVAQYFAPHISYSIIKTWLNDIVQQILSRLKINHSTHSIFSTSSEQFSLWEDNNINDNFWNPTEAKQIMNILVEFIFSDLDVHRLLDMLYLENEYLNRISKFLRRYLLTITFYSVARRLGLHCAIELSGHQICFIEILWNPNYNTEDFKYTEYLLMTDDQLLYPSNIARGTCNYNKQFRTLEYTLILREIIINFLQELIDKNIHCKWKFNLLFRRMYQYTEETNIETGYKNIINKLEIKSNRRRRERGREGIKFAVGMIVTHSWNLYHPYTAEKDHDGVIIGWHMQCDYKFNSKLEETRMFPYLHKCYRYYHICICEKSSDNFNQPHYIILTENNRICYVQQDHILPCSPKMINNIEIGRFFSGFEGTHYVLNKNLEEKYPRDTATILEMFSNQ